MTKQEFLEKAREVHGYKYEYPNLEEKVLSSDRIILLYDNIEYSQNVGKHLIGRCPEKNTPKKDTEQFIKEAKLIWGDKYDYSLVEYTGANNKVKILFKEIIFEQVAISHLKGFLTEDTYNKEYFLLKAKEKWGDKYDYSLVEYIRMHDKVKILFNDIIYEQSPSNHLTSAPEKILRTKTTEEFIKQSKKIHGDKFTYEKTVYVSNNEKVIITCPIHDDFLQIPNSNLSGSGCIKCGYLTDRNKIKKSTEDFIQEAKLIWGDKYDYSLTEYINAKTKIKIIYYDDIVYEQFPGSHLKYPVEGYLDQEIFIKRAKKIWGNKYDYSLVDFKNSHEKIKIIYEEEIYEQFPLNHFKYSPELRNTSSLEKFILKSKEYHGDKYSYDKCIYVNDKMLITCSKHGDFLQKPQTHYRSGCPHCNESKGEKIVNKYLEDKSIKCERQFKFPDCKNILELPFDFYIPSIRMCIEFDGEQHFMPIDYFGGIKAYNQLRINDKIKNDYCEDNYISLVRIRYDQIDKIPEILYSNLKNLINL